MIRKWEKLRQNRSDKTAPVRRHIPGEVYVENPCSLVAVGCASIGCKPSSLEFFRFMSDNDGLFGSLSYKKGGYLSLPEMNRLVRSVLSVRKYVYCKKGFRVPLSAFLSLYPQDNAIVVVTGHVVYAHKGSYDSFFDNGRDLVTAVWFLE